MARILRFPPRLASWMFVLVYAYGGILCMVHAPAYALGGGLAMYAAGLIAGLLISHPGIAAPKASA